MFKGTINRDYLAPACKARRHSSQTAIASIETLNHPLLESFRWEIGEHVVLICRERCSGANELPVAQPDWTIEQAQDFCSAHRQWPLDYQTVYMDRHSGTVTFCAGHGGVAPLYLRVTDTRIDLSWSVADFYPHLTLSEVDVERTGLRLIGTLPYAATTMFRGVFMLTERASLSVRSNGVVETHYPPPAPYYIPTPLLDDADVTDAGCRLVDTLLRRWPLTPAIMASEFSGGLDSAIVAAILARQHPDALPTYALQIEGIARNQKITRRALAIKHFGFRDHALDVDSIRMVPTAFGEDGDYVAAPYNADLQRPLQPLLKTLATPRAVATGTGGDELLMAHAFEQDREQLARNVSDAFLPAILPSPITPALKARLPDYAASCDRAPFPVLPISVLEAQAARSPLFSAHGIWPISPFAQPEAVRFYRSLPLVWRQQKRLHRQMLKLLGYPERFLDIPLRENFESYLASSLVAASTEIARLLSRCCLLHELGLVDVDRLIAAIREVRQNSPLADLGFIFHAINLEHMLRRINEPQGKPSI
ncbi:asparagine synthase-related protein [Rhizobium hainanense]|uniref:Asparagine synthase (Glutamine-hydrolysing) n=1 Tax=Rhizobium hainanense TaxID=52131 RepID=A0A1C3WJ07_9HYPH|nr:asparagine synthase-related protein [Rhizobium hainanense]SCB39929.1 asparagine synthase (glutamine-hydrolysing) [Rhizobium hainanense]